MRTEWVALIPAVVDARSDEQTAATPMTLRRHPQGAAIAQSLNEQWDRILVHGVAYDADLPRVTPEWYWRDFRLHCGRNHGSEPR